MKNCWFMVFAVMLVGLLLVTPYVAAIDSGDGESTWSAVTKFAKTTSENSKYINKLTEYFPEDVLAATIKNVDDYDGVAVGTKRVLQNYKMLDDFAPELKQCAQGAASSLSVASSGVCDVETAHRMAVAVAEKIKSVGKTYDGIAAKYGEDVAKITVKGVKENVIDPKNAELPDKLAQYVKELAKDPLDPTMGEEQLLNLFSSQKISTIVGNEKIISVANLKKGVQGEDGWGWDHISIKRANGKHHSKEIQNALGLADDDASVKNVIGEVLQKATPNNNPQFPKNYELIYRIERNGRTADVLVAVRKADGSVVTAYIKSSG